MKAKNPKGKAKKGGEPETYLLEFFGTECPHCIRMAPVIEEVESELKVKFLKLEVWHSEENQGVMQKYSEPIEDACGGSLGVPCFFNTKTKKALCGEVDKAELIEFAKGK